MKIILATGIYPPEIGGPATYVSMLASALQKKGHDVTVIAYGKPEKSLLWNVIGVDRSGGPIRRWMRYAQVLRKEAGSATMVEAFSSISAGIPCLLAGIPRAKKVLRLGGDFFWERATDRGDIRTLREWHASRPLAMKLMLPLLRRFARIVYSTEYQRDLYEKLYNNLPRSAIIENPIPHCQKAVKRKNRETPLKILFFARFVRFKNGESLIRAMASVSDALLTMVGQGPEESTYRKLIASLKLEARVVIRGPARGEEKERLFAEHDCCIFTGLTEMSPNGALEALAAGIPVLMTNETGLSQAMQKQMTVLPMRSPREITAAIERLRCEEPLDSSSIQKTSILRTWDMVADEHLALFSSLR